MDTNECKSTLDDNEALFFLPTIGEFSFFAAHLFRDLWDMRMINGIKNTPEVLSLRIFLISSGWFAE